MVDRAEFVDRLDYEIEQAGKQRFRYSALRVVVIVMTVVAGASTTFLAGIGYEDKILVAALAFITTILGTFEKTFSFGRVESGCRKARTLFQNLGNDVMKVQGDDLPPEYVDRLNEIRNLKVQLTDSS